MVMTHLDGVLPTRYDLAAGFARANREVGMWHVALGEESHE